VIPATAVIVTGGGGWSSPRWPINPKRATQAGEQFVHAEGFGDVVVDRRIQSRDLVALALPYRQHDDRHVGPTAESMDHLDPVDPRQPQIEDEAASTI
jgi:hypothetical protein